MSTLRAIRQIARSGDTERAWQMFEGAGLLESGGDADILTLKGRLLKDKAIKAADAERSDLFTAAQSAYLEAASLLPSTYPLINAATIALLDGRREHARALAGETITMLDSGAHEPETPYWLGATRAEAELLLGRLDEAKAALTDAVTEAPAAWEDHASTLRHFRLILNALEQPSDWLDRHRPPASLHFSGIVRIGPDEHRAVKAITEALDVIDPGFAFGALAAGADIIVAEILVERGAQLHVVLPSSLAAFRRDSVRPFGEKWEHRFDALIRVAESIEPIEHLDRVSEAGIVVADEIAMGLAIRQARILESSASALRVGETLEGRPANRALDRAWVQQGHAVHAVSIPREGAHVGPPLQDFVREAIVALPAHSDPSALIAAGGVAAGVHAGQTIICFAEPAQAARAACAFAAGGQGHALAFGLDYHAFDPDEPVDRFELVTAVAAATPPGAILITRQMALALALEAPDLRCETYGEIATPIGDIALHRLDPSSA